MIFTNRTATILGILLAAANGLIAFLYANHTVAISWSVALSGVVLVAGVFGVQLLTPAQIVQKLPAHVAAAAQAALTGLNAFLLTVNVPTVVHIVFGAVLAVAGALGIVVTGIAKSNAVKIRLAGQ